MIITLSLLSLSMIGMYIVSSELFYNFINLYHENRRFMDIFSIGCLIFFIVLFCFIFIKRINFISEYLGEISFNLKKVSNGDMDINIPIRRDDELGRLAEDVNKMASDLQCLMEKERVWERDKNNLITNLSHDLRTPLTSILGFLELIKNTNYKDEETYKHYCSIALSKTKELNDAIEQLFEFTSINNVDVKLNKQNISLDELVEQVIIGFIPNLEKNNMEYRIVSKNRLKTINVDVKLLLRAFENLIINSIKYGCEGKYLDIELEDEGDKARISFINYGEEIKEEDMKNLFEKFYRIEKTCKKKEGTGLGLAIVKAIVEQHKGEIKVLSSKEKTEFRIELPYL